MNRLGETNINSKGERFAIKNYRNANDVDVIFEVDNSVKNTTYAQVKSGHVSRSDAEFPDYWLGEVIEDNNGEECKIVEVDADNMVTVQYLDGDIVSSLSLQAIMIGAFDRDNKDYIVSPTYKAGIDTERKATYENVVYMLARYRRAVMIRPCGFGKTKIGLKLFSSPRYQKCLFLHPASDDENARIIKKSQSKKKIDTRTYAWLRSRTDEQIGNLDYDIVFCDEVHCIGGNEDGDGAYCTYKAMKKFMETHPATHFVGATATPIRMDGINVIATMFHNHLCYPYTDEDAFEDGILKRPHYYYCIYDVVKKIREEIKISMNVEMDRDELQKTLKLSGEDIDEIDSKYMDKHIKNSCDKILPDTKYMRFIAFYLTNKDIDDNKEKVLGWFKKAYPNHQISSITVTNRTNKSLDDVDALPTEPTEPGYEGRIDIIFNCEKLCMGYHSELITGLILDRKTVSLAKYLQMIGRLLSCDDDKPVIIFDIADNIHSDFVCKDPRVKEEIPVAPEFLEKAKTFEEIVNAYPNARHWEDIRRTNKKAKKSEKMLIDAKADENTASQKPVIDDIAVTPVYMTEKGKLDADAKKAIEDAWQTVKDKKMTFAEACNYLAGIEDEYGTIDPHEDEYEQEEEAALKSGTKINIKTLESKADTVKNVSATSEELRKPTVTKQKEKEPIGFNPTYYYDQNTRALYSRNVQVLNKRANFEEDIKAAMQIVTKSTLDKIIREWHKYPTCEENYKDYAEIDRKSGKFKFLKSCSEFLYGVKVENTLIYMVEGKIA